MTDANRHGLSRYIPADVRRVVRQRSKFGCVICRRGFYQYEHIDPPFEDAKAHDPDRICCLCGSCHDSVTRGHLSKAKVNAAYRAIQTKPPEEVSPPVGPLDFHDGSAELMIGGLLYSPAVQTVLRYHGVDLIRVIPGRQGEPGRISAVFTDEDGRQVLQLVENEWVGVLENWDIEVVGQRITVRRRHGEVALQLRLDPPSRIVVERIDMRIADGHVLATEQTYAVGRHITDGSVHWVHAGIRIRRCSSLGAAIEFADVESLQIRDERFRGTGQELATRDWQIVVNSDAGVMVKPLGIVIASLCGAFDLLELAVGNQPLDEMRRVMLSHPDELCRFISTSKTAEPSATADRGRKADPGS
ncbi:hypothetical protein [Nitrosomonas sp. Is37]|uniref:HNH endonuclease n=1 Tax=Nitrosomonas sp. Is37 TaxID=3080535 RepID=UPI00294B37FF|nr:hypothetical protein [Nitrosomonas sp. Is37]MDV6344749.1 hypothetical protein [Nitrosomonas sp. Is37]